MKKTLCTIIALVFLLVMFTPLMAAASSSSVVFKANFDSETPAEADWYVNIQTVEVVNGFDGKAMRVSGNGGSLLLMGTVFRIVDFEPGEKYTVEFDVKNNWSGAGSPTGLVGFNDQTVTNVMTLNYLEDNISGGNAVKSFNASTGAYHLKTTFVGQANGYIEAWFGYDPSRPNDVIYDLLIDNIVIYKGTSVTGGGTNPGTGDSGLILLAIGMLPVSGVGMILFRKKKV